MNPFRTWVCGALLATMTYPAFAVTYDHTQVILTNNTPDTLMVTANLLTDDNEFIKGNDWDVVIDKLEPYESREVMWFVRDMGIREGAHYRFTLKAGRAGFLNTAVETQFEVSQKPYFGSYVSTSLRLPEEAEKPVLEKDGLEHYAGHFWGADYQIHARTWKPKTQVFNNYHLVIDQSSPDITPANDAEGITVLTYNTQLMPFYTRVVNDLNQPEVRVHDIPKKITQYDVVIMEELFDRDLRNKMYADMKAVYPYHTTVVGHNTRLPLTGGVVIFSKWPIEKEDQVVYKESTGVDALAAKGAGYAMINKLGKHYHIFGTHLVAGGGANDQRARLSELKEMKNLIDRQGIPADEPVLIGGDMNVDQFSGELQVMLSTLNVSLLENRGFKYSADATTDTMNNGHDRGRIDYVFYSNEHVKPAAAYNRVYILRAFEDEKMWPKFDLSDHFPVDSYFRF